MPVVNDATVVASAYNTSGNGGRKLVRLSDNTLISAMRNGTTDFRLYKSTNNGTTWTLLVTVTETGNDVALATDGTYIFVLNSYSTTGVRQRTYNSAGTLIGTLKDVDISQTAMGNISIVNNGTTELHAVWSSKTNAYPNSFNIRYAKGTINTDGSVTWGAAEQRTTDNSTGIQNINPTIIIKKDGNPSIFYETQYIINNLNFDGSSWSLKIMYTSSNSSLTQSSPSAIFVPQSINGLTNGLMGVTWHGKDATHTTTDYIRFSKSLDGGVTFSVMQKLVPGTNATLATNKYGKLFITYEDAGVTKRIESTNNGDNWSTPTTVGNGTNPSSLLDLTMNPSVPLTIRKGASSVLFNGSWIVTTNSVPPGEIGQKTDKSNILTYSITTDGTMSTIIETVNGVTVGTKTATSGQSLSISLTQAQWDAVKYGKYATATGDLNTLTVEMGAEIWTYTFDKQLPANADLLSAAKASMDAATVSESAKKVLLAGAVRRSGGSANDTDSLEVLAAAIGGITLKKWASGNGTGISSTKSFQYASTTSTGNQYYVSVTGLTFKPSIILIRSTFGGDMTTYRASGDAFYSGPTVALTGVGGDSSTYTGYRYKADVANALVTNTSFLLPFAPGSSPFNWIAFE